MRFIFLLFVFTSTIMVNAQQTPKTFVEDFFKAFHKQDTTALKAMAKGNITMQSIGINKEGKTLLKADSYEDFLKSIAGIPSTMTFEEKILDYQVKVDGPMANVWTPYEFWINGNFSHCGVNSFQLMKEDDTWKLIYLVDTRRREGCKKNNPKG